MGEIANWAHAVGGTCMAPCMAVPCRQGRRVGAQGEGLTSRSLREGLPGWFTRSSLVVKQLRHLVHDVA
jgi:hypothetical protein